jgi:hypothetical protein
MRGRGKTEHPRVDCVRVRVCVCVKSRNWSETTLSLSVNATTAATNVHITKAKWIIVVLFPRAGCVPAIRTQVTCQMCGGHCDGILTTDVLGHLSHSTHWITLTVYKVTCLLANKCKGVVGEQQVTAGATSADSRWKTYKLVQLLWTSLEDISNKHGTLYFNRLTVQIR